MSLCDCSRMSCCHKSPSRMDSDSTCPPHDRRHIKAEFPVEPFICSPEVCKIYGSHDRNEPPGSPYPRSKFKSSGLKALGSPIGLVKSSFIAKTIDAKGNDLHALRFGTYLKAFANIYLMQEDEWVTESIDMILNEGQKLFNDSKQKNTANDDIVLLDIYSDTESKISRTFDLSGYTFQIELNDKFQVQLSQLNEMSIQETKKQSDVNMQNVRSALKQFFKESFYCLLKINNWYILVWRTKGVYFVLDVYGRRLNDFVSDRDKGFAMLICVKSLINVEHLIRNLSAIQKTDMFSMRELRVVKLTGPDGKTMSREYGKRVNEYEIVNTNYAYLKSALHLSLNPAETLRRRSAFPSSLAALLASKIDHPATWNEKMLDKIICYGVYVCRHCWEQCMKGYQSQSEDISRFPNKLKVGQYYIGYKLITQYCVGVWKCVPNHNHNELFLAIEQCFDNGRLNLLIQLGQQFYAVWKKGNIYYLFDSYRHRICWNVAVDDKYSTLRMFSTKEHFFIVFQQLLLESNKTTTFYIHTCQVNFVEPVYKLEGLTNIDTLPVIGEDEEVKSLNETICFDEDETQCLKELGEISDYEDDEMIVGVAQIDLSSESETDAAEEAMEEEEGGGGLNMDEVESSSSGDDHGGRRLKKKKKSGRDRSKSKGEKDKKGGKKKNDKKKDKDKDKDKNKNKEKAAAKSKAKNKKEPKKQKPPKEEKDDKDKKKSKKQKKKDKGESSDSDDTDKKQEKKKKKKEKEKKESDDEDKANKAKKQKENKDKPKEDESNKKVEEKPKEKPKEKEHPPKEEHKNIEKDNKDNDKKLSQTLDHNADEKIAAKSHSIADRHYDTGNESKRTTRHSQLDNKPNNYPGYSREPRNMAVVGSESGTYESICKLLRAGFKCADRIMIMTPWGNFVVFRGYSASETLYFLFDGCTCNINRFRHLDLNCGTAGLLCFENLHDIITYIIDTQKINPCLKKQKRNVVNEICNEFC